MIARTGRYSEACTCHPRGWMVGEWPVVESGFHSPDDRSKQGRDCNAPSLLHLPLSEKEQPRVALEKAAPTVLRVGKHDARRLGCLARRHDPRLQHGNDHGDGEDKVRDKVRKK